MTEKPYIPIVNLAPFFVEDLQANLEALVGDAWSYTLPATADPEQTEVKVTVSLG